MTDLGLAAKVRPCLLLTDWPEEKELALFTVIHHTTACVGNPWELVVDKPFLKKGAFHLQQINTISPQRLLRKLGTLTPEEMQAVQHRLAQRFGF